jgi:hypothetical protein
MIRPCLPWITSSSASAERHADRTISACAPISAGERAGTPPAFQNRQVNCGDNQSTRLAALDQILGDRQTDLAHTDNTDRLHTPSRRTDCRRRLGEPT